MREFDQRRLIRRHLLKGNGGLQMIQALLIFMPGSLVYLLLFKKKKNLKCISSPTDLYATGSLALFIFKCKSNSNVGLY